MAGTASTFWNSSPRRPSATTEPWWVRTTLTLLAVSFLAFFLLVPLGVVLSEAIKKGADVWKEAVVEPDAQAAVKLTLLVAAIVVPVNALFGVAAAWAIARFSFRGKSLLTTVLDLPFAVSPVIAGLIWVLLFGANSALGAWLEARGYTIIFALPGIVLASAFVTMPFVAREVLSFLQAQGAEQEEAALSLGASSWQMFQRVTLPNIKWPLFYGIILCNARAMGEFGAVSVVSGHVRGETNTLPLHVEILYNEYEFTAAFAMASLLVVLALFTLVLKQFAHHRAERVLKQAQAAIPAS
jgi:sulfate transport system permease protein